MNPKDEAVTTRLGAYTALAGSICALTGAGLGIASGADLDTSLAIDDMTAYLSVASEHGGMLVANLTLWIAMVVLLAVAATAMSLLSTGRPLTARLARFCYWAGTPLVIASYVAWLAVVVQLAPNPSPVSTELARVVGWFASRADWVATIFFLSIGPLFISLAGRDEWVPTWLLRWSFVAVLAGFLNALAMLTGGGGLTTYGFLIIPVGVGWMIAASVVLFKRIGTLGQRARAA